MSALFVKAGAPAATAAEMEIAANVHFRTAGILDSFGRLAHAMAQIGHESDGFHAMEEYASSGAYEGRKDLGTTQPGDGARYKGRGPIQITGQANYRKYGRLLGVDLESRPTLASAPSIGMMVSYAYWAGRQLNAFADRDGHRGADPRDQRRDQRACRSQDPACGDEGAVRMTRLLSPVLANYGENHVAFWCPGCNSSHVLSISGTGAVWGWN
jgi:putative chitinase